MLNTLANIPPGTQAFYDRNLLVRAVPADVHGRFGQLRPIAKRNGNQIKFRRYESLPVNTTPLTEGVTPSGSQLTVTDIISTLQEFGDFVTISDLVDFTNQDPVLTEAGEVLGEQGGTTVDITRASVLCAGTNVIFQNGVVRTAVNTPIDSISLRTAIRTLARQNTKFMRMMIMATTGISTAPVRKAYMSIIRADTEAELEQVTGYLPISEYSSAMRAEEDEVGAFRNIRFFASENAIIFLDAGGAAGLMISNLGVNADVYCTLVLGANAYGVVPLSGEAMRNIVKPLGSAGTADPLNQRATSGWKAITTTQILNDNFMTRIEHANRVLLV